MFIITALGVLVLYFLVLILPSVVATARKSFSNDFYELPLNRIKSTGRLLGRSFQVLLAWNPSKPEDEGFTFYRDCE
jgi:hypothetical protein